MGTGLGMTESSPFAIFITNPNVKAGYLGVPTPAGTRWCPPTAKTEVRYQGTEHHARYFRGRLKPRPKPLTKKGFLHRDAVQWIDENDVHQGLKFDGRIASRTSNSPPARL